MRSPKVFISYSHDSEEHMRAVLNLSNRLRSQGVECTIDQYEISPGPGWTRWSFDQIEEADFVVVVCTETYWRRYTLKERPGRGRGVKSEGLYITQYLFDDEGRVNKFIPVVFTPEDERHIPRELRRGTFYVLDRPEGYESLYRHITGQPRVVRPPLGEIEVLPPADPQSSLPPPAAVSEITPPVADFVGREEFVERLLGAAGGQSNVILLYGVGGIGKTETARLLAHRLSDRWPAQLYFDLKGTEPEPNRPTVAETMYRIIRRFKPSFERPQDEDELAGHYHSVLRQNPALLLLDDAADRPQVEPFARLPKSCMLLVTSRQRIVLPGALHEPLPFLSDAEAAELLLKIAPRIGADAPALAEQCGGFPLALRLAAGALAEQVALGTREYVERLRQAKERLKLLDEASIELSEHLLGAEERSMWRALSVFPQTFDRDAAAAVWRADTAAARDVLSAVLEPRSLVMWDANTGRFRLHDLLRLFADKRLTADEREEAARRHAFYYAELLSKRAAPAGERLALFDAEQANIVAGFTWAAARAERDVQAAKLCSDYVLAGRDVLRARLAPGELLQWALAAKRAARLLDDPAAESRHTGVEGLALADLGDLRSSVERYRLQLEIARRIGDAESECAALLSLGSDYRAAKELTLARHFLTECVAVASRIKNPSCESTAYGQLGLIYKELRDYRRALGQYRKQLRIAREQGSAQGEGWAYGSIGFVFLDTEPPKPRYALRYLERWLSIARKDRYRVDECNALGGLGLTYHKLGENQKAVGYCLESIQIAQDIGYRRGEGAALGYLGQATVALGDVAGGIRHYKEQIEICRNIPDPEGEAYASRHLAEAYLGIGEIGPAVESLGVTLEYETRIGHPFAEKTRRRVESLKQLLNP